MPSRKGSPNKNKMFLLKRLQDMYGDDFHPILRMAENATKMQELLDEVDEKDKSIMFQGLRTAIDAWEKVAQYTEPKLKAVEHTGADGKDLTIKVVDFTGEYNGSDDR